jgi:hypothetical protein
MKTLYHQLNVATINLKKKAKSAYSYICLIVAYNMFGGSSKQKEKTRGEILLAFSSICHFILVATSN